MLETIDHSILPVFDKEGNLVGTSWSTDSEGALTTSRHVVILEGVFLTVKIAEEDAGFLAANPACDIAVVKVKGKYLVTDLRTV